MKLSFSLFALCHLSTNLPSPVLAERSNQLKSRNGETSQPLATGEDGGHDRALSKSRKAKKSKSGSSSSKAKSSKTKSPAPSASPTVSLAPSPRPTNRPSPVLGQNTNEYCSTCEEVTCNAVTGGINNAGVLDSIEPPATILVNRVSGGAYQDPSQGSVDLSECNSFVFRDIAGSSAGAVCFENTVVEDGLRGTLDIKLADPIPLAQFTGFSYRYYPLSCDVDGNSVTFPNCLHALQTVDFRLRNLSGDPDCQFVNCIVKVKPPTPLPTTGIMEWADFSFGLTDKFSSIASPGTQGTNCDACPFGPFSPGTDTLQDLIDAANADGGTWVIGQAVNPNAGRSGNTFEVLLGNNNNALRTCIDSFSYSTTTGGTETLDFAVAPV